VRDSKSGVPRRGAETFLPAAASLSRVISSRSAATTRCNSTICSLFDNQALQRRRALCSVAWRSSNTPSHINRHFGPRCWSIRDYGWASAGFHALANSFAFADFCGTARRNAPSIGTGVLK